MKIIGIILILFAATGIAYQLLRGQSLDIKIVSRILSVGLFFIFFSREKIEDERIHQLKFHSLAAGFVAGYLVSISIEISHLSHILTIEGFIALVLTISTVGFYFAKNRE